MAIFTELRTQLEQLTELVGADAEAEALGRTAARLGDEQVVQVIREASALIRGAESLRIIAAGIASSRSRRDAGHRGLAQSRGHRNAVELLQDLIGCTKSEAQRHIRLGESLLDGAASRGDDGEKSPESDHPSHGAEDGVGRHDEADDGLFEGSGRTGSDQEHNGLGEESADSGAEDRGTRDGDVHERDDAGREDADEGPALPWHAPLDAALLAGRLSSAQHDAILRGLGEPVVDALTGAVSSEAWSIAASQLLEAADACTVEELGRTARSVRDRLDPEGADRRYRERFERRSFRRWTDADGQQRGSFAFDDEAAAWVDAIINSALRPRRGGPRFVDSAEQERAKKLADDPRTNDQLAYDLMIDVLRAGALADAADVFGARQPGVRLVQVVREDGQPEDVAHTEDQLITLPAWLAQQRICDSGTAPISVDARGNPLNVGREQRLFTSKQRTALALRDGGCRWHGCDRPASYCESHHIDHYSEGGRTDIDRGILLCRFHHMALHNGGSWITRDGKGDFVLHHRSGGSVVLKPRLALSYAWAGLDPPSRRFRPSAA